MMLFGKKMFWIECISYQEIKQAEFEYDIFGHIIQPQWEVKKKFFIVAVGFWKVGGTFGFKRESQLRVALKNKLWRNIWPVEGIKDELI